ncbi:MAG: VPDSG-CTERM sorting domain-containing protein [Chthoniobacterales bacterium]
MRRSLPEKRFALYGVAVGAALAAGAGAPNADANLVTLDLTGLNATDRSTSSSGNLYFDVNAATASAAVSTTGTFTGADFKIFTGFDPFFTGPFASISGLTANNAIAGNQEEFFKASNLASSHMVGPMDTFGGTATIASFFANFGPGATGFLGLKFEIGSDIHYGWANITVGSDAAYPNVTLNALGYETNADTPAHTEAPSSGPTVPDQGSTLALMALGAAGLAVARNRVRLVRG